MIIKKTSPSGVSVWLPIVTLVLGLLSSLQAGAAHHEEAVSGQRTELKTLKAEVIALAPAEREVVLKGPQGRHVTLRVMPDIDSYEQLQVGDRVEAEYRVSIAGDVRAPTEEERLNPLRVLVDADAVVEQEEGLNWTRTIRAVCTIVAINSEGATYVMVRSPRGYLHTINDIKPATLAKITVGDQVVINYSEALALSLKPI
jgi:hypothetical protein